MRVTYYRNWFDGTYSRHPRVRYGSAHLLNNLYSNVGVSGGYGVGITCAANVLVEGNYFENTPTPILISQVNDPGGTLSGDPAGYAKASNNYLSGSGAVVENLGGYNFNPADFYLYTPGDAQGVKNIVKAGAGAGVLNFPTSIYEPLNSTQPAAFELYQNYPNPFNPVTVISYQLAVNSFVTVRVYDLFGREVATLISEEKPAGTYTSRWDATYFASGVYFCRLQAGKFSDTKKLLFVK
jgi:Pectate lyase/Secretion system C-terminal sorting domain